jgi:hypothetical protein
VSFSTGERQRQLADAVGELAHKELRQSKTQAHP